jgi:sugar phosphate isomerase/epimerase
LADRIFGISTRLFCDTPLTRDHLVDVAAHGFEAIELYGASGHFDYRDLSAAERVAEWLSDTRLFLHSIHAPSGSAVEDILALLTLAPRLPFSFLVMHRPPAHTERTLETITGAAAVVNVKVALEMKGNADSTPQALVTLIEDDLEGIDVGICLDFGRAHLLGDLGEAIETVSGHLWTTHVHDNGGKKNDHLVPYAGSIHWDTAMMETQKVGYDGAFIFELAPGGDPVQVLSRAAKARERLEQALISF